jgi:HSP20 family molecular chaperone IbpA
MKFNSKEVILEFDLHGFHRDDIKVKLSKNDLSIKAIKKVKSKIQKKDFFHSEFSKKFFKYETSLPKVNPATAKVEFKKGILKIRVMRQI